MKRNIKRVGDLWILDPPQDLKDYLCNCEKPGNPVVSQYNIVKISEKQTKNTRILKDRYSIINILAAKDKPLRLLEIGTAAGDFAQVMIDSLNIEKIILIDKFDTLDIMTMAYERYSGDGHYQFVVDRFKDNPKVEIIKGFSIDVLPIFIPMEEKDKFDFIYIDSDHSFHNVYNELLYASQILKKSGVIGMDDFTSTIDDPMHPYEVMQAVTQFLENNTEWNVEFFTFGDESYQNIYISREYDTEVDVS